jgi:hypothetical protein
MRPARIIAATVVAGAAFAVAGCADRSTDRPAAAPPASTTGPAATATTGPAATATTGAAPTSREPAVLADGRHPVLLKRVDSGGRTVTFDLIQFYQGEQAAIEAAKDRQESPPPNDVYIRNVNSRLRTLPVAADATITVNGLLATQTDTPVTLAKLASLTRSYSPVFRITVRNGQVVKIAEVWLP